MSKDYENLKMDDLKLFELDMNPQCDLCYNVQKPIQSLKTKEFTPSLNFEAKGECCLHYENNNKEQKNICIKDSPETCFKVIEEVA